MTCSSARVREKLDILGEKHDQAVLDMQKTVSEVYQVVTEKEAQVANLAEKCADAAHICTEICTQQNESATKEVNQAKVNLNTGFAIAGKLERRHMSKDNQNFDFHWVNHKIVKNQISGSKLDNSPRNALAISNITVLPSVQDQQRQRQNYIVLIARMLVEHLDVFAVFKDVCIRLIPHKHGKEMAKKSESVSIPSSSYTNKVSLRKVQKKPWDFK